MDWRFEQFRKIAAERLWMSPFYNRPSVGIHFTWHKNVPAVTALLPAIETALAPFQPRPHWGKLFRMDPRRLQPPYPKLPDFRALLRSFDPRGVLKRGYAIVRGPDGRLLRDASAVDRGAAIAVQLSKGALEAEVKETR